MASGRERLAALRRAGLNRPTTPESLPAQASGEPYSGRTSTSLEPPELSIPLPHSPLPRSPLPRASLSSPQIPPPTPSIRPQSHASDEDLMASILTDLDALHAGQEARGANSDSRSRHSSMSSSPSTDSMYSPAQEQLEDITTDLDNRNSDRDSVASVSTLVAEEVDPMEAFYSEIESLQNSLQTLSTHIRRISELHARALDHPASGTEEDSYTNELTSLIETTAALSALMKRRIKVLESKTSKGRLSDVKIRKSQTELIKSKFIETLQNYQEVEQQYRAKYKQRMERQFRIVNPEASPEEVRAVVDNTQGGQIFTQALMSTNRHGESRAAFREVQARHEDIKRIEETLCELAKMFEDMATLVEQQDETIAAIETKAAGVEKDTEVGLGYATVAVNSARAARKKRWICFALAGVIVLIFIIAIGASIKPASHDAAPAKATETKAAPAEKEADADKDKDKDNDSTKETESRRDFSFDSAFGPRNAQSSFRMATREPVEDRDASVSIFRHDAAAASRYAPFVRLERLDAHQRDRFNWMTYSRVGEEDGEGDEMDYYPSYGYEVAASHDEWDDEDYDGDDHAYEL